MAKIGRVNGKFILIEGDTVYKLVGSPFGKFEKGAALGALTDIKLDAPVAPGKIVAVGLNYAAHAAESGNEPPPVPLLFLKATTSLIGPGEIIVLPPESERVDHECELAIVIGKAVRRASKDKALDFVLGYTLANDVTARDLQKKDGQWARAKSFDTFCPLGPWIDTDFDPYAEGVTIRCKVNGEVRQESPTDDMIHKVADVIAYASAAMTLEPGDVIITGTPSGISALNDGDEVTVEITGLGELTNTCKDEK